MAHLGRFRANAADAASAYVAISQARMGATIYTDSRASLTDALGLRDGAQVGAMDGLRAAFDLQLQGYITSGTQLLQPLATCADTKSACLLI
jgi:hypothetical protein